MSHSNIVGGSTAKRLINCPGSRALVNTVPEKPSSKYAEEGSRLHDAMHMILSHGAKVEDYPDNEKLILALDALNEIDPNNELEFVTEVQVHFNDFLAGVYGSCDLAGRIRNRAIVLDWKFGDGVAVDAEENEQLMFYCAAGMRTEALRWVFEGVDEIELIIVQPPYVKRWLTTPGRIKAFERTLYDAVQASFKPNAPYAAGDHCRWCAGKPVCPLLTGQLERAVATKVKAIDVEKVGNALAFAILAEEWAKSVRELAQTMLENNASVPGWKLVPKWATRQWVDAEGARKALEQMGLDNSELIATTLRSPAQIEKVLKKHKLELPKEHVVAVSTGNTIAPESDPRPAVSTLGDDLIRAFSTLKVR
jgi:short-subunit dehydrogenase involved in D-alanine esterification of teichoic acids